MDFSQKNKMMPDGSMRVENLFHSFSEANGYFCNIFVARYDCFGRRYNDRIFICGFGNLFYFDDSASNSRNIFY